ncbi:4-aminobutyrate aminotransferase [Kiloniella spongiae]|uniref:4-aminobutyrate aminotransferase n=1 Tax=Kiloniella spongiae TaxID=1489064 RepID=A0A0H2MCP2_9PROT|nr:4-aminobutyrate--2-oxoglutarate transaminase [Kiloniella spongiae]KLN60349.1 4-aminobutyrate aminotransferase [Kiloniella spongiae]
MATNSNLLKRRVDAISRGVGFLTDFFAEYAENSEIWDVEGRRFIDFGSGIGVCNTGHRHPKVMAAIEKQLSAFTHTCHQVTPYENYIELAEKLNAAMPGSSKKKTAFVSTGAEAVENAIKIARAHTGRPAVISCAGGFHGRTFMGMSLTGKVVPYKVDFGSMMNDVFHFPFPNDVHGISIDESIAGLERLFKADVSANRVAAIIFEPTQGEGGFYVAPKEWVKRIRAICDEHGIVMIADEVQSGFGRTGKFFAMEHYGVEVDLMTSAKGLGGGMPISAVIGKADIMDAPNPGGLGGTYAGNAVAVAAANAVCDIMSEEAFHTRTTELGVKLKDMLNGLKSDVPQIADVRGQGLMVAVEFIDGKTPRADMVASVVSYAKENGLILLSCGIYGNCVRFLPPLTIQDDIFDEALGIISNGIKQASNTVQAAE